MMTRLRERLHGEDGISLVEMLVSMVVLAVAMLAMVNGMMASAASVLDQQSRTMGTRVASEYLEGLRLQGFDEIQDQIAAGTFPGTSSVTVEGRTYDVATTVTEVDAETGGAPVSGQATVLQVDTTLQWTVGTNTRSVTHQTAIAPDSAGGAAPGAQSIQGIDLNPSPSTVIVGGALDGQPTLDVSVTVILQGFEDTAIVKVTWVNDSGGPQTKYLASGDGGVTWSGTIPASDIRRSVPSGEMGHIAFTVHAGPMTSNANLPVVGQAADPPVITDAGISPSSINLNKAGKNVPDVTFWATVANVNTTDPEDPWAAGVRIKYQLEDGTFQEISLVYEPSSGRWEKVIKTKSERFKSGTNQEFMFTVLRSDGGTDTAKRLANVVPAP